MATFDIPSRSLSRTTTSSDSDESFDLPFPEPLPRSSFLTPDFNPQTFLSSLGPRHQTLEDLRSDLHTRSQSLNTELLDLVNSHYSDFLSLGSSVRGQGEKVEELRVGVMGVRREVEGVAKTVRAREGDVSRLLAERKSVRAEMEKGQRLLRWCEELDRVEGKLERGQTARGKSDGAGEEDEDEEEDWSSEADEDEDEDSAETNRLKRRTGAVASLQKTAEKRLGVEHPFVMGQWGRVVRVRNTVVLDLREALGRARANKDTEGMMELLGCLRELGAEREAIGTVKGSKR